jgi:hypothetical protein
MGVLQLQQRSAGINIGNDHEIYQDAKDPVGTDNFSLQFATPILHHRVIPGPKLARNNGIVKLAPTPRASLHPIFVDRLSLNFIVKVPATNPRIENNKLE